MMGRVAFRGVRLSKARAIPDADPRENNDSEKREQRKPDDGFLAAINDDRRGQEWPQRTAGVAAYLEDGLRETETTAGAQMRYARRFRMENRRADADERDRDEDEREIRSQCEEDQADQGGRHPERE